MNFYLGTHLPHWLATLDTSLFVSHRRLADRKSYPRARRSWALDSGGFTELSMHGQWVTTAKAYARAVHRYQDEIGQLAWCAPQDWMCEPFMLAKTGLTIREHQERTIHSYRELAGYGLPVIPVLQGWTLDDYQRHAERYDDYGIQLQHHKLVGLGSVCRRQATSEIGAIVRRLAPIRLHAFGCKSEGLRRYGQHLVSADSMAWSYSARMTHALPGCTHRNCANCARYALRWRDQLQRVIDQPQLELALYT